MENNKEYVKYMPDHSLIVELIPADFYKESARIR
jgi:hypothetical protein